MAVLFCLICLFVVAIIFAHTVNYPWQYFDAQIIYNETVLPIPASFSQIFEYVHNFGLNNHFEASNPFYSTISNVRCDPLNTLITLFVFYFFQKNASAYHLLSLSLHIFNSFLLFLLINKVSLDFFKISNKIRLFLVSLLTLLWSLHPVNVESLLFSANWAAIVTYSLCLILLYYYINFDTNKGFIFQILIPFILYLFPLLNSEYSVTLPLILFSYIFANHQFKNKDSTILQSLNVTFKKTAPLIIAVILYALYFLFSPTKANITSQLNSISLMLERIFWLMPQIFIHYLKLIVFPLNLTIDQTTLLNLPKTIFSPYAIFTFLTMYIFVLILIISFLKSNKRSFYLFFITFSGFFIALAPFLHIISPTYNLASERYLYFPLLLLIFGFSHFVFYIISKINKTVFLYTSATLLTLILVSLSIRTYVRTYDWKDNTALFTSALNEAPNDLYKGLRLQMLGSLLLASTEGDKIIKGKELIDKGVEILEDSLAKLETEKQKYQENLPDIIKAYGLDPKTIQAKTAYLLSITKIGLEDDWNAALDILSPYMKDLSIIDTQILDLYIGLLFQANRLDEAEEILNHAARTKMTPVVYITLSLLHKKKYNDLNNTEEYLLKSFKYFPYDIQTLARLKQHYFEVNKPDEYAKFSYLYGIRTHSKESLIEAYNIFTHSNNEKMAKKSLDNVNLIEQISTN